MFSIIVPMYNVERYAEECIDSILKQTMGDFELIIVDDGSTDGTASIINSFSMVDKRIIAIRKENGGVNSARKAGAKIARGDYIVIVDGDDWIEKDYLKSFEQVIKSYSPDIIICGYTQSDGTNNKTNEYRWLNSGRIENGCAAYNDFLNNRLLLSSPTLWAKCFKRDLYFDAQMMIDDSINMGEDGCISFPLIAKAKIISVIDNYSYHYRSTPTSLTRNRFKRIPFESVLWRIKHLKHNLPKNVGIDQQMAGLSCHALFNAIRANYTGANYSEIAREVNRIINDEEIKMYFSQRKIIGSKKDKIAHFIIKHRMFWIIKLFHISNC